MLCVYQHLPRPAEVHLQGGEFQTKDKGYIISATHFDKL